MHIAKMANLSLSCQNLTKTFGQGEAAVPALRGINLEIERGEFFLLTGPSGCGKTTLISVIGAILDADDGECLVLERNVAIMTDNERADFRGQEIGFVFQSFNLLPALTALENVAIPLLLSGRNKEEAQDRAFLLLKKVGLESRANFLSRQMSGGQQQRVAIARALANDPSIIICDEPTSNLDHETGRNAMELLRDLAKNLGKTVIIVTHDPRIYEFADRIAYMDDGRIIKINKCSENAPV